MKHFPALFSVSLLFFSPFASAVDFYEGDKPAANNPMVLHLFPEAGELRGWISGTKDVSGQAVTLQAGEAEESLKVEDGNRFRWKLGGEEARTVTVQFAGITRVVTIPPAASEDPVAFFVVDRSVYRPGGELQFAAFLRQRDEDGQWHPLQRDSVEVEIKSVSKQITAAKLKLTPDEFGRVTGTYQFSKADGLDDYTITVRDGIGGSALVKLAEFRKAKVRLEIGSERVGDTLTLKFRALDFLNKTVPASKLRFTARVVKKSKPAIDLWGLDPGSYPGWEDRPAHWDILSAEQQALIRAGEVRPGMSSHQQPVHTVSEELEVGADGRVEYALALDPSWIQDHVLEIDGTLIDANNREQKASKSLPLGEGSDQTLELRSDHNEVPAGQTVKVTARTSSGKPVTFAIFRLRNLPAQTVNSWQPPANPFHTPWRTWNRSQEAFQPLYLWPDRRVRLWSPRGNQRWARPAVNHARTITREFLKLSPGEPAREDARSHQSQVTLSQPGAYVVQAITHDDEGHELRSETALVVKEKERANGLYLELASNRLERGEPLRGIVQSRYDGARVLLAVRDSGGIRTLHPVTIDGGQAEFEIALPENLSLGGELTARYTDDGHTISLDRRRFLVAPPETDLQIASEVPETVEPGEEVELEINVNRREEVDLVVSVYDQSLLGIAPERPVDGRSLFHADLRIEDSAADALVAGYLAGLTPNMILRELKTLLEEKEFAASTAGQYLQQLNRRLGGRVRPPNLPSGHLTEQGVRTLLAWRGAPIQFLYHTGYWQVKLESEDFDVPVLDLIKREGQSQSRLAFDLVGDYLGLWSERIVDGVPQYFSHDPLLQGSSWYAFDELFLGGGTAFYANSGFLGRGDAHRSVWASANSAFSDVSANAFHSNISGQAMISHLPAAAPVVLPGLGGPAGEEQAARTIRRDFSDSAFFDARVRTDAEGMARVNFKLPDSLTNWRVVVTAVTRDLQIARHTASFKTLKPVMVWPMLSQSFTSGDRVHIFATVHNYTEKEQEFTVSTSVKNGTLHGEVEKMVTVPAKSNAPIYFDFEAGSAGFTEILMVARCAAGDDASLKRLPVTPCAAEQVITRSGFVKGETSFEVPEDIDLTQARLEVTISPSLAGDMLDSLAYLVDYPHGCVEQTMSRFLPVIKVAQILERFEIEDEKLKAMVPRYAEAGIKRLLQLQQEDGGWGWNGNSQTHEMMTPYALFGLVEAQKAGFEIPSQTAIPRGMDRLAGFINGMGDGQSADRIYCMWVYRHHARLQDQWWQWLEEIVDRTVSTEKDRSRLLSDYAAALALEMAADTGRRKLAGKLERLLVYRARRQGSQAHWTSANFSRWGNDRFEITAAVLKAFAAHDPDHKIVPSILSYFVATKRGNRWNSTKDTAMILYAMCDYLSTREIDGKHGAALTRLAVNGHPRELVNPTWRPATLVIEGADLQPGRNKLAFLAGDRRHLYRAVFRYWRNGEDVSPLEQGASVSRTFELIDADGKTIRPLHSGDTVPRGSYIRSQLNARIANGRFDYTLSVNPKLSCGEYTPLHDQQNDSPHVLKESKASGTFWHHEQSGNSIRTYSVCRAELAGEFLIAPAYVELMYDTAIRGHSGSFKLIVKDEG